MSHPWPPLGPGPQSLAYRSATCGVNKKYGPAVPAPVASIRWWFGPQESSRGAPLDGLVAVPLMGSREAGPEPDPRYLQNKRGATCRHSAHTRHFLVCSIGARPMSTTNRGPAIPNVDWATEHDCRS